MRYLLTFYDIKFYLSDPLFTFEMLNISSELFDMFIKSMFCSWFPEQFTGIRTKIPINPAILNTFKLKSENNHKHQLGKKQILKPKSFICYCLMCLNFEITWRWLFAWTPQHRVLNMLTDHLLKAAMHSISNQQLVAAWIFWIDSVVLLSLQQANVEHILCNFQVVSSTPNTRWRRLNKARNWLKQTLEDQRQSFGNPKSLLKKLTD